MSFWKKVKKKIEQHQTLMLMVVVKIEGSSPGKPGFKMVVAGDGEIWGSIGGGNMEFRLTEQCRRILKQDNPSPFLQKQDHHPDAGKDNSGMICSGVQWIAFYPLNRQDLPLIENIIQIENDRLTEAVSYTRKGIAVTKAGLNITYPVSEIWDNDWNYSEQPGLRNTLYIFGAGHVSLALSKLAKEIGFDVMVFDNRKNINTFDENIYADQKKIIDYSESAQYIPDGNNIYVAIMTFAHKSDTVVLKQLLNKKVKYLGMMGSELKVESVFETLQNEGISKELLSRIDSPIGLPINSITPAEIAVSIIAKIIAVKNA